MAAKRYTYALGKRKTAVAQVHLYEWAGESTINGIKFGEYIKRPDLFNVLLSPLKLISAQDKYYFDVKVNWSWESAQVQAIKLGISRALSSLSLASKKAMKASWFLTRDARKVERKKPGLHKARKATQWSKR
ncbi:MAG: 30S ribosomal protein S9 [uncultured bacterium (gcode 4)]|uniref:Small ribosomal subunit protein uS9 n=1 Tax=uncultured bacterium (gcode 4) TaxID=1234023 RepID=K2G7B0_9BACT|nr:MAG: 30S ribosomal protein S9 [uncultured bacterium (gcode 4)]